MAAWKCSAQSQFPELERPLSFRRTIPFCSSAFFVLGIRAECGGLCQFAISAVPVTAPPKMFPATSENASRLGSIENFAFSLAPWTFSDASRQSASLTCKLPDDEKLSGAQDPSPDIAKTPPRISGRRKMALASAKSIVALVFAGNLRFGKIYDRATCLYTRASRGGLQRSHFNFVLT